MKKTKYWFRYFGDGTIYPITIQGYAITLLIALIIYIIIRYILIPYNLILALLLLVIIYILMKGKTEKE